MRPISRMRAAAFALLLVGAIASPAAATWSTSPFTSLPLCTAAGSQQLPVITADGSGGAYVAWLDDRGAYSVYVTHVTHGGTIAPGWPVDGLGACTAVGSKNNVRLVPGGSGDVYVLWEDDRAGNWDVYAQRLLGNGTVAPGWPANGLALGLDTRNQQELCGAVDGAGGLYAAWTLEFTPGTDYDIYATRVLPSGAFAAGFAVNGMTINGGSYVQSQPDIAPDGAGNAIIVFANEDASALSSIWGQKLTPAGARPWGSPVTGQLLSAYSNDQRRPLVVSDGAGGALLSDIFGGVELYYTLLDANGNRRDNLLVNLPAGLAYTPTLVPDGAGGAWTSVRSGTSFPFRGYLLHVDPRLHATTLAPVKVYEDFSGAPPALVAMPGGSALSVWATFTDDVQAQGFDTNVAPLWGSANVTVAAGLQDQFEPRAVSDGADGAIVAWTDRRDGNPDIYAARVDRFGALGDAAPAFTRLADVPNDQGGFVSLQWQASARDVAPSFPIARYSIWRRVPGGLAVLGPGGNARVLAAGEARPEGGASVLRAVPTAAGVVFWEYLAQVPARGYAGYSAVAPTTSDSLGASNPRTSFRIEAEAASGIPYWDSAPDSTYSVDNIPPVAPAPFTGTYSAGTSTLAWQANAEPDIAGYRLHRGASSSFVPSPANLLAEQSQTGYSDAAGSPWWYKLAAVDVHGNVSAFSTLLPAGVAGVDGPALPRVLALARPMPNPAHGETVLSFALPAAGPVTLAIYDAAGRRVRALASGSWAAGGHAIRWDGAGESGEPAGPGLYFARLQSGGRVLERRLVMIR